MRDQPTARLCGADALRWVSGSLTAGALFASRPLLVFAGRCGVLTESAKRPGSLANIERSVGCSFPPAFRCGLTRAAGERESQGSP
jgi:hypothetical protein